jgi:putative transposase
MSAHQAEHSVTMMARLLGVSTSGFYAWKVREPSDRALENEKLLDLVRQFHSESDGNYGRLRITKDLHEGEDDMWHHVGHNRVGRLMRAAGLRGVTRRKECWTTTRDHGVRPAPDLVHRDFVAEAPNQLWVADITYIPTWAGFLFLAVVLDVFSRRIVGWSMANHLRTELILDALEMAIARRKPENVIHHSDQGCQYTSLAFGSRCREAGVRPSMGSVGDCFDNAMCESFFATLECELLNKHRFPTQIAAMPRVFNFIEGWYNTRRRHSSIDYLSPIEFERRYEASLGGQSPTNGFQGSPQSEHHASV